MRNFLYLLVILLLFGCAKSPTPPVEKPVLTTKIRGQVFLENQEEHSNCAILDSALTTLTGSDSSGHYTFDFKKHYRDYSGIVKVCYFLHDYARDTIEILLNSGYVVFDTLNIDSEGNPPVIFMRQILLVEGWVSDSIVHIGDHLVFTGKFTNVTKDEVLNISFENMESDDDLSCVTIYKGPFEYSFRFTDFPSLLWDISKNFSLNPGESAMGINQAHVPPGAMYGNIEERYFVPLDPDKYIMSVQYKYLDPEYERSIDLQIFLLKNWENYHRGALPTCPKPQKYKLPTITVIN